MLANLMTLILAKDCFCRMATKAPLELLVTKHLEVDERIQLKKWMKSCNFNENIEIQGFYSKNMFGSLARRVCGMEAFKYRHVASFEYFVVF